VYTSWKPVSYISIWDIMYIIELFRFFFYTHTYIHTMLFCCLWVVSVKVELCWSVSPVYRGGCLSWTLHTAFYLPGCYLLKIKRRLIHTHGYCLHLNARYTIKHDTFDSFPLNRKCSPLSNFEGLLWAHVW